MYCRIDSFGKTQDINNFGFRFFNKQKKHVPNKNNYILSLKNNMKADQ